MPAALPLTTVNIPSRIIYVSERDDLLQKYASNLPDSKYRNNSPGSHDG